MNRPNVITLRPRSLRNILADLKHAKRDYDDALADKYEDRASEAETRFEDLRGEADALIVDALGMTFEAMLKLREDCLL